MNIPCAVALLYNILVHHLSSILVKRCFIFFNTLHGNCATPKVIFVNTLLAYVLSVWHFRLSLTERWLAFRSSTSTYQNQRDCSYKPSKVYLKFQVHAYTHILQLFWRHWMKYMSWECKHTPLCIDYICFHCIFYFKVIMRYKNNLILY